MNCPICNIEMKMIDSSANDYTRFECYNCYLWFFNMQSEDDFIHFEGKNYPIDEFNRYLKLRLFW